MVNNLVFRRKACDLLDSLLPSNFGNDGCKESRGAYEEQQIQDFVDAIILAAIEEIKEDGRIKYIE